MTEKTRCAFVGREQRGRNRLRRRNDSLWLSRKGQGATKVQRPRMRPTMRETL